MRRRRVGLREEENIGRETNGDWDGVWQGDTAMGSKRGWQLVYLGCVRGLLCAWVAKPAATHTQARASSQVV